MMLTSGGVLMMKSAGPILACKMPDHPVRRPEVIAAAVRLLETGAWTRLEGAPETEAALRDFHGGGEVWFVASGTAALEAIMLGHGIGPGDEVVTTPYTWGATVSSILAIGAVPIFADIDRTTGLLDVASVAGVISPRTRAILAVHLFGHSCDAVALRKLADERGILFFEDGSQAHGARLNGERVGRFGHAAAFSCMAMKLLGGTEGGYAVFEDRAAAEGAYLHGKHPRGLDAGVRERLEAQGLLDSLQLGWRPSAVSAVLVGAALPFLDGEIAARRANAARLRANLADVPAIVMPPEPPGAEGCYHLLSLLYDPEVSGVSREHFVRRINSRGAGAFIYVPTPIHRLRRLNPAGYDGPRVFWHDQLVRAGIDYRETHCPNAEWRSGHSVEFGFNWTVENFGAMDQLAEVLRWCVRLE
jgi:dTDP-4-amino-4,6-dideoxygalactose transaminase